MLTIVRRKVQVPQFDEDDDFEFLEDWNEFVSYMQKRLEISTSSLSSSAGLVSLIDQTCTGKSVWDEIIFTLKLEFDYGNISIADLTSDNIEKFLLDLNWHFSGDVDQDKMLCAWETIWEIYESDQDVSPKYSFSSKETSLSFWGDKNYF